MVNMVNNTTKPQNFQERQKRQYLEGVTSYSIQLTIPWMMKYPSYTFNWTLFQILKLHQEHFEVCTRFSLAPRVIRFSRPLIPISSWSTLTFNFSLTLTSTWYLLPLLFNRLLLNVSDNACSIDFQFQLIIFIKIINADW